MADSFSVLTDREGRLSETSADASAVVGRADADIGARRLFALFADDDRAAVTALLQDASNHTESGLKDVRILTGDDNEALFDITLQPAGPDRFWVFFTPAGSEEPEPGPAAKENFLTAVADRLRLPGSKAMRMIMLDFGGLRNAYLGARLGEDGMRDVRSSIEGALADAAVDGQVGRLDADSYGVLGDDAERTENILNSAVEAAERHGVSEEELGAQAESVSLGSSEEFEPESLIGLLSHAAHMFRETIRTGRAFAAEGLRDVSVEIEKSIELIETALARGNVAVTARDVRRLADGDVSLYLAAGALRFGDEIVAAERLLVLEDHPELCVRHDRAVVAAALERVADGGGAVPVIVDINLPTLESGEAARIASEMAAAGRAVGFRPHGVDMAARRSRGTREVSRLLKDGIPVWLINFSAAIAGTRRLRGAYVEVSATFLRDISAGPDRNSLLSRLLKVWHDVEVRLVALNVDSKNLASFVNKLGIAYGVGVAADPAADAPQSTRDATA